MKKILLIVLSVLVVSSLSATPIFQVGPTVEFAKPYFALEKNLDLNDFAKIENYSFGLDARVNLMFLQLGVNSLYGSVSDGHNFSTLAYASLLSNPVKWLTVSIGLGASMDFFTTDFKKFYVNSSVVDNFVEILKQSPLYYRAQIGFDFKKVGISLSYNMPTKGSFAKLNAEALAPNLKNGKFRISLLFNFL